MHQFVQSAIEAANQGDKNKAIDFLKQVLSASPNDVDAWLVLAAVVDEPDRKRQCLKRVLALDPVNQLAREELLEMDRAAMGGNPTYMPELVPASPANASESDDSARSQATKPSSSNAGAQAKSKSPSKTRTEKPLVFKYPLFWRIIMYPFAVISTSVGLFMAMQNLTASLPVLGFAALGIAVALVISPVIEVSNKGISVVGLFSVKETGWDEIASVKFNTMKSRLELTKRNYQTVNVFAQISGYPQIEDMLRQRRPDLFGMTPRPKPQANAYSSSYNDGTFASRDTSAKMPVDESKFKNARTFKLGFFRQYGWLLLFIPSCCFFLSVAMDDPHKIGAWIAVFFGVLAIIWPFIQVGAVKVQGNKLSIETFLGKKEYTAQEIHTITIQTQRKRRGFITHYVNILTVQAKSYDLIDFPEKVEVIYNFLNRWLDTYKNRD